VVATGRELSFPGLTTLLKNESPSRNLRCVTAVGGWTSYAAKTLRGERVFGADHGIEDVIGKRDRGFDRHSRKVMCLVDGSFAPDAWRCRAVGRLSSTTENRATSPSVSVMFSVNRRTFGCDGAGVRVPRTGTKPSPEPSFQAVATPVFNCTVQCVVFLPWSLVQFEPHQLSK
jgi:hypothetical protein